MRYLVISDIHANLPAFETVLEDAKGLYDQVWCLGDISGRGPYPNECVELLRTLDHLCVAGNEDWAIIDKLDLDDFPPKSRSWYLWAKEQLTDEACNYLNMLPEVLITHSFTLVHGSPRHPIWEHVLSPKIAQMSFEHFKTPYCLIGHTLVSGMFQEATKPDMICDYDSPQSDNSRIKFSEAIQLGKQRLMINPGSVGLEKGGYSGISYYGILNTEANTFEFRRVHLEQKKFFSYFLLWQELKERLTGLH
jgi:predicted phosphodiesterase